MKKILVSILLITYVFASSGASVDLHYCMGKLMSWDFDYTAKSACNNCGMKTKPDKGCCDNKQIQVKVDKEQQVEYNNIDLTNYFTTAPAYLATDDLLLATNSVVYSIHAPPLRNNAPVFLFNCNFRI